MQKMTRDVVIPSAAAAQRSVSDVGEESSSDRSRALYRHDEDPSPDGSG
jgi:hypothetical protein